MYQPDSPLPRENTSQDLVISQDIKQILRRKVSSYLSCHFEHIPAKSSLISKNSLSVKKTLNLSSRDFPPLNTIVQFQQEKETFYHLYKQKLNRNMDECLYFYLKLLCLAMDYECKMSKNQLDRQSSIMAQAFVFLVSSWQEAGMEKAAFHFGIKAITFCQLLKQLNPIGQLLLIMAKITRKLFRYKQSIILLKKALEYNWWQDQNPTKKLETGFLKWLVANNADQVDTFVQKFEIIRIFKPLTKDSRSDLQLEVYSQLFKQYLQQKNIRSEKQYDVGLKRATVSSRQTRDDLQLQIYNQMSYNFLQLNYKEQSKLFEQKYQSGYIQPDDSSIRSLSKQLIKNNQARITGWQLISPKSFELIFFVNLPQLVEKNRSRMKTMDKIFLKKLFDISFQGSLSNLLKKESFNYEIPLPLELKRQVPKKKDDGRKFIVRRRSTSQITKPKQLQAATRMKDVQENMILNYRGIGMSKIKLINIFKRFSQTISAKQSQGSFYQLK